MPSDWWPMPFFGMMMMPIMMVVFLVIAVLIIIPLMRAMGFSPPWMHSDHRTLPPSRTALDLLSERFARAEIDQAEFEERRRVILQH